MFLDTVRLELLGYHNKWIQISTTQVYNECEQWLAT